MGVTAIVGANWGDEGKGKMTDYLTEKSDVVVRYQGGNNAGHTVINDYGKFALHLLPSGVFFPEVMNILGPGVAVNIAAFLAELATLTTRGVPKPKLMVSDRAQVLLPFHQLFDQYEEERLSSRKFGSTRQGIAPFYADKYAKTGIQIADLYDAASLKAKIEQSVAAKNVLLEHLYHKPTIAVDALLEDLRQQAGPIEPYVADTTRYLNDALRAGRRILVEGQLGALRDPDHGIYPYSTSSSPLAGFATVGAGVPPASLTKVIAVVKAYSSCVGEGPFVSEIHGEEAQILRDRGGSDGEYGATTGRPRRMGWFDVVATRYGCMVQGATDVALSLLDVLGYLDKIPVCTAYRIDGKETQEFPVTPRLARAQPVIATLPGWKSDIRGATRFEQLPPAAQEYVRYIERSCGVPVTYISTGPHRKEVIVRNGAS
jgi:adenylosuccinate synthase